MRLTPLNLSYIKPYNINNYILGKGAFGLVFRSTMDNSRMVAIKTVPKSNYGDTNFDKLTALLSELKIMIYLGKHPNIVQLIGAVTTDIRTKGVVCVVIEYCPYGSLYDVLKNRRKLLESSKSLKSSYSVNIPGYVQASDEIQAFSEYQLLKFSHQVSMGMEYLSSCKVRVFFESLFL